jgi:signal transduction histidine kinase
MPEALRRSPPTTPSGVPEARQWVISLPELHDRPDLYDRTAAADRTDGASRKLADRAPDAARRSARHRGADPPSVATEIDWEVRDALKAAARQVASYLGVRRAVESLVQARQFESFNRMSAFVVHDLKNLVAQLSLLLANAERHRDNPEFQQDMLDTVGNVQTRMQGLLLQLRAGTRPIEAAGPVPVARWSRRRSAASMSTPEPYAGSVAPELQHARACWRTATVWNA